MSNWKQGQDQYGFIGEYTPMGEERSVSPIRLVGATFIGTTIDTNFWAAAQTGTAAGSTQANGSVTTTSGTTTSGTASLTSVRKARYTGGSSNRYRGQIQLGDTGNADNIRRWGMFDGTDGAYFELNGTTLNVVTLKTGTPTRVASTSWNNSTTTPTLTNVNSYEIYITNSKVYFIISDVLKHTASFPTSTWTDNTNLPVRMDSTNSAGTTAYTITARVMTIYRLGNLITQPTSKYQAGTTAGVVCKYGAGNLQSLILSNITAGSVVTLYDNTAASGTILFSSGAMAEKTFPFALDFKGIPFSIGLTLVIATQISDATVIYE
jgi:hypothetical protein